MEEITLFGIVNWIFCMLNFLRLFMSFKYGLILLRYSSSGSVLFPSLLLSNSIYLLLQELLTLTGLLVSSSFSCLKGFLISLSSLSLIALVSFCCLERFLISLIAL